ncbi:hypothetical protein AAC387_Pa02g0191 [Persea americana]
MAISQTATIALITAAFGIISFILGVVAENKKPAAGIPISGKGVVICKYPSDPTVPLGSLSAVFLFATVIVGLVSVFYPYKGKSVPTEGLFRSTTLAVFFAIATGVSLLAEAMMIWATVTEGLHLARNVHHNLNTTCPTAKTGLFGGAAFLALDAALFWLVCQMLTLNARADYLDEDDLKGDYGQVVTTHYDEIRSETVPKV